MNKESIKETFRKITIIILSFITVLSFSIEMNIREDMYTFLDANTFIWVLLFAFYVFLANTTYKIKDKRLSSITFVTSIIIAISYIIGYMAENYFVPDMELTLSKNFILFLGTKFLGCAQTIYIIVKLLLAKVLRVNESQKEEITHKEYSFLTNNKKSFFIITGLIIFAYLPYMLQHFPGIASSDPGKQALEILGVWELTNHHPVFHSIFIYFCLQISKLFTGNYSSAVGVYCMIQILVVAMTFSFVLYYMAKKKIPIVYRIVCFFIFAFFPLFPLYAITVQKDIFFAVSVTLFTIGIIEICTNAEQFFSKKRNYIYLICTILGTMFFRNNGIYVILLSFLFLLFVFRKQYYKSILGVFLTTIVFFYVMTTWGYAKLNIKQGSAKEMFSIPLQFFARLEQRENENLTQEEKDAIYQYLPVENLGSYYNPRFSDPVKKYFSDETFANYKLDFIKLYIKLALKFPGEAIKSFICNSYGYYYPDTLGWGIITETFKGDSDVGKEMQDVLNWNQSPIIQSKLIQWIEDTINKKEIPMISMFYSIGFMFWIMLVCMAAIWYQKKYKLLLMFIPVIGVWLTSLASPVFGEMRYVLSLFMCLPILFTFSTTKDRELLNK